MKKIITLLITICLFLPLCISGVSAEEANAAPTVIPAIREWSGGTGRFELKQGACIVIKTSTPELIKRVAVIHDYFKDMLSFEINSREGSSASGDILLVLDSTQSDLGTEGYLLEIEDSITVTAATEQGIFYGCITILQSLYADGYVPKGNAKDYPAYEIRSGMIDVARAYLPLEYVEEITKYMAWFKLNEIHLHINDNGENNYSAFRLESDVPGLTSEDGFYTKTEYRAYQKRMLSYGISVLTEIDTPAHSKCFNGVVPADYMLDENHIDITNPDAVKFIDDLFDEYITGDDPVFLNKKVHIGTDEYPTEYSEEMRAYINHLIEHIHSRGCTPRFWGGFGNSGFNGTTAVSNDAEVNFWAVELSDYNTLFQMGYDVINTCGPVLYVVPGGNYGFADYYDLETLYENWFVNYMGWGEANAVDPENPQLKGASFALWNDRHTAYGGFSTFDIFDRLKGMISLLSEKTWCGEQTRNITAEDFIDRYDVLSLKAGNTNPGRTQTLPITEGFSSETKSVGFPYITSFNITVEAFTDNCVLFDGSDGQVALNNDGTISLFREGYEFLYKCSIQQNVKTKLKFIADNKSTILVIDDTYYYSPINKKNPSLNESSTFVFPLEELEINLQGSITDLLIERNTIDKNDLLLNANYALGKSVTVSGLEVNDGSLNEPLAVDGNLETRLSFARDADEQWMVVDLGSEREINAVEISFFQHIKEYKILTSTDGITYTEVYHAENGFEQDKKTDTINFSTVKARYVKYLQLKRFYISDWNAYYSGGISEFAVYGYDESIYKNIITEANTLISSLDEENAFMTEVKNAKKALQNYMTNDDIYTTHINALKDSLVTAMEAYSASLIPTQTESSNESLQQTTKTGFSPWWLLIVFIPLVVGGLFFVLKKKKHS